MKSLEENQRPSATILGMAKNAQLAKREECRDLVPMEIKTKKFQSKVNTSSTTFAIKMGSQNRNFTLLSNRGRNILMEFSE